MINSAKVKRNDVVETVCDRRGTIVECRFNLNPRDTKKISVELASPAEVSAAGTTFKTYAEVEIEGPPALTEDVKDVVEFRIDPAPEDE